MASTTRAMKGGWVDRKSLPKGPGGRSLCRWCNLEVPEGRYTFCSDFCVNEWKLRSDPGYLRDKVFERDRGVCAACGLDTVAELTRLKRMRGPRRVLALAEWGMKGLSRRSLWDADHIVPVMEGGGECDLDNIRTLCLRCHRKATAELRERTRRSKLPTLKGAIESHSGVAGGAGEGKTSQQQSDLRARFPGAEK